MDKKKSNLQKAADTIALLAKQTNDMIMELGIHANGLNNALSIIQMQFDKIRNVSSEKKCTYEIAKNSRLNWIQQVDRIENDYESTVKVHVNSGATGACIGVGVAALGPTAAMSVATTFGVASTGTAISSLSGAAATNAALAWLGGGALTAGGGGMVGGSALLALAGPVGWSISLVSILSSGWMYLKAKSNKKLLETVFMNILKREEKKYELSIIELKKRITRIKDETSKLRTAIVEIGEFGLDYDKMTEQQQYSLGTYVNLMYASSQLLINPIMGLKPNYTEMDLDSFLSSSDCNERFKIINQKLLIYFANLLYKIDMDKAKRKLLAKTFKKNREFLKEMNIEKSDVNEDLMLVVDVALNFSYNNKK